MSDDHPISVRDLTLSYGSYIVMHDVAFEVRRGDVFAVMGGSGCGKSTLLKCLVGLLEPASGEVRYEGHRVTGIDPAERQRVMRHFGVLFQYGALWSGLTLLENVILPLEELTSMGPGQARELAELKIALVGLRGFEDLYPSQLSGGMRKRAGLARAMVLDPDLLFFDEPSSGLDPVAARRLDELILQLREELGTTIVVITHDLASIFTIASNGIYLDAETKTVTAWGAPREMLKTTENRRIREFLTRGTDTEVWS